MVDPKLKQALETLHRELRGLVEQDLTPIALKYGYTATPLNVEQRNQPVVLFLGDFAAGKSTLINELLGSDIQVVAPERGQDVFTLLVGAEGADTVGVAPLSAESIISDTRMPFTTLRRFGPTLLQRMRVKRVASPLLENLILVDTPAWEGESKTEGFHHEDVIRDFLRVADVIVILLTPQHVDKVRDRYEEIRKILPRASFEDKVVLVLNRVDQCASMGDLLRVYGSLCWSVAQASERRDIPPIHLMYTQASARMKEHTFLSSLTPIREGLKNSIMRAPVFRLDHVAVSCEEHGDRLAHFLEALVRYGRKRREFIVKTNVYGLIMALLLGVLSFALLGKMGASAKLSPEFVPFLGGAVSVLTFVAWLAGIRPFLVQAFHQARLSHLDDLTILDTTVRKESWDAVKGLVKEFLESRKGRIKLGAIRKEHDIVLRASRRITRDIRAALIQLMKDDT